MPGLNKYALLALFALVATAGTQTVFPGDTRAVAQTAKSTEHRVMPPKSDVELVARVEAMRAKVYDRNAVFSRSQVLSELYALAKDAEARKISDAHRDTLLMIGLVESKGGDAKAVIMALEQALEIKGTTPLSSERLARSHHLLAEHLQIREAYAAAAIHYRQAMRHMADTPAFNEDQRLGTGQELGYVLHEAKNYQEALDNNLQVLTGGERIHGATNPLLRTVITNIAQNLHALGRKPEAEPYLVRALAMTRAEGKVWNEQDLLFQIGVLAFETGRSDEARRYMRERIDVIKKNDRKDLLANANEDLRILEDKIKTGHR
jgi:tetratricopeptide (TPR) repeat protein